MHPYFTRAKPLIARELRRLLDLHRRNFGRINSWGPDLASRLRDFSLQGKMVRGGLLILGYEMHAARGARGRRAAASPAATLRGGAGPGARARGRAVLTAAAAIEIIHSSLLIHDDIMDNDRLRRGGRTIFAQYEQAGKRARATNAEAFGRSMGICAGDVGYFLAWEILSGTGIDAERRAALLALVSRELSYVGLAQMQDVAFSAFPRLPSRDDILALYMYKTARYTFALPLMAGALIAGAPATEQRRLCELGERLGVIFQVRDDELGIFGSEKEIGKPVGSDIREGKKTLLYLELIRRARGAEKRALVELFGKQDLTAVESRRVRDAIVDLGARSTLARLMEGLAEEARRIITSLPVSKEHARILREICDQSLERKS